MSFVVAFDSIAVVVAAVDSSFACGGLVAAAVALE